MPLFVQKFNSGTPTGTASSVTVSTTGQTAGNMNLLVVEFGKTSSSTTPVTVLSAKDELNNNYLPIGNPSQAPCSTDCLRMQCFMLPQIPGGNHTITVQFSAAANFFIGGIYEYNITTASPFRCSAAGLRQPSPSQNINTGRTYANQGDLLVAVGGCYDVATGPPSGFTQRDLTYILLVADNQAASTGPIGAVIPTAASDGGVAQILVFQTPQSVAFTPASGEVLLNDTFGGGGTPTSLQGANNWTLWIPGTGAQSISLNAGAPVKLTKFKFGVITGCEDMLIGATLTASNDPSMFGAVTLWTAASRANNGALLNVITINSATAYQYYVFSCPAGAMFPGGSTGTSTLVCLDFYATWSTGCICQPSDLTMTPTTGGFDIPIQVSLSCSTSSAAIHYTLDGSTPTLSSPLYTGPFLVSSSSLVSAIASSPSANGNSRYLGQAANPNGSVPFGYPVHIGQTEVSTDVMFDDRGYRIWAQNGTVYQDPVSKLWYWYGMNSDSPQIYIYGFPGTNIYSSADLRNWKFVGVVQQTAAGNQNGATNNSVWHIAAHILYNAANNNYVLWTDGWQQSGGGFLWFATTIWTSSTPYGPFTQVNSIASFPISANIPSGDFSLFLDSSGTAYFVGAMNSSVAPATTFYIAPLNSAFTAINTGGSNYVVTWPSIGGQPAQEAPYIVLMAGIYFLVVSDTEGFAGSKTTLWTANNILGPYTKYGNPFQPVPGGTPDYTISYNSQVWLLLLIPGRTQGCIYLGDTYGPAGVSQVSFAGLRRYRFPVTQSGATLSISWNPAWSFNAAMPSTGANSPASPTGLTVNSSTGAAQWSNVEPNPCKLYFDVATDSAFNNIVSSNALADGSTSFTAPVSTSYYYRVRNVNASGSSVSNTVTFGASPFTPQAGGNPPFLPLSFPTSVPATKPGGGWNTYTGPQEDGASAYANTGVIRYNGQNQPTKINQTWRP